MKGAEKIFIHGEEIARQQDLKQEINDRMNAVANAEWQAQQYTNQKISEIPEVDPQKWVDSGFDYTYEDPDHESPVTITVEPFGDSYGFDLGDDGYYVNNNAMIDQSYAMCKIIINNTSDTDQILSFKLNQQSENGFDFGMFSVLNADLVASVDDTSTNVAISFQNYNGDIDYNIGVPVGESYVTVKYKKDGSGSQLTDTFKFKMVKDNLVTATRHLSTDEQVEEKIKQAISTVYKYKGSVANEASLPTTNNEVGDVYNCEDTGNNFAWDGTGWDKLAGTIDMSNYYTKAQSDASARAIADEKIAAIPVNNLLHYKGHVETVEALPSLGQASGTLTDSYYTVTSDSTKAFGTDTFTNGDSWGTYPYVKDYRYFFKIFNESWEKSCVLSYNNPEQIKIGCGNLITTSNKPCLLIEINASEENPVVLDLVHSNIDCMKIGTYYDANTYYSIDNDPNKKNEGTFGKVLIYKQPVIVQYNIDTSSKSDYYFCGSKIKLYSNTLDLKFTDLSTNVLNLNNSNIKSSIKLSSDGYVYTNDMIMFSANLTTKTLFQKTETTTELNDTYTVGDNYDIYRRNEKPAWEHWSQGVSKEYVDSIVGGVNTELESIINGEV